MPHSPTLFGFTPTESNQSSATAQKQNPVSVVDIKVDLKVYSDKEKLDQLQLGYINVLQMMALFQSTNSVSAPRQVLANALPQPSSESVASANQAHDDSLHRDEERAEFNSGYK